VRVRIPDKEEGTVTMTPELLELIAPIVVIPSVGIMVLVGIKMRLNYLRDLRVGQSIAGEETQRLVDEVSSLRDEVLFLREGFEELNERIGFHERLLTKAAEVEADTPV
jgi:hypothetical protein